MWVWEAPQRVFLIYFIRQSYCTEMLTSVGQLSHWAPQYSAVLYKYEKGKIVEFYHYEDTYTVYTHEIGYGDICVFLFLHTHSMSETNSRV